MTRPTEPVGFHVAAGWPQSQAGSPPHSRAIQALIANHTLIVGQSRSGKTNAARRLIEEILTWTDTRVVILDPNADFRLLGEVERGRSNGEFRRRWRAVRSKIGIATPTSKTWGILWKNLSFGEMAAFLRLSADQTFTEYRHLDRHCAYEKAKGSIETLNEFASSDYFKIASGEDMERYQIRLKELAALGAWATPNTQKDIDRLLEEDLKAVVMDLSIDDEEVRTIIAARTLEALWRQGEQKRGAFLRDGTAWPGTLVLIDEAHLFAPPSTSDLRKRAVCERIERLADQGKKLNLYLMVITQMPSKLHKGVLSECSNRIILRVNERLSLRAMEDMYGGMRGRYDGALTFNPGEALMEGSILCDEVPPPVTPRGTRFLRARTKEGGGSPDTDWAKPRQA